MLRCKKSYTDICSIEDVRLVGNSLVAWPANLRNCRRVPHPQRDAKPFLRDKILCRASGSHIGNVQNNLAMGDWKDKHVALFRATDTVLDCGQGVIIDFPSWKAMREMLVTNKPEVSLSAKLLLKLAGNAEEEVAAGLAEEVPLEVAAPEVAAAAPPAPSTPVKRKAAISGVQPKKPKFAKREFEDPDAWLEEDLGEYPNTIQLVSSTDSEAYAQLVDEAAVASTVAYDAQWSPDFDEGTDNQIALLQLAFPQSGNTYVLQLPLLGPSFPAEVKRLFESNDVSVAGFAANEIDIHKFEISGINIDRASLFDIQPWCEAEMGENESVKQGWRVGLKRAADCVLDFEMEKTSTIASSNWEREELTTAQVEYAAMDVWVALRLYQRLAGVYRGVEPTPA
mmetsp:Transcript_123557/g.357292  ORF Transcript_123557/g.357292 Transcript_123557/m.357292 type:complete len:396 (-) Transcript_123557:137-1324(-)